ncbi:peptidoglycan editing factor PgeF [Sedimenticola sp.]|uniref:peptidoglycan editing factor PgeF n=1 Tax=Sedimenticola sp. TaxID=1940285 RepID=UPI003D11B1CC
MALEIIRPDWPVPASVHVAVTTRIGGVSLPPYDSLNLGAHVGDNPAAVEENRHRVSEGLHLPNAPRWLSQVHGTHAVDAATCAMGCEADASHTDQTGVICAVLTADCLPVLFCDSSGRHVAVAHAGWRGLLNGVIERAISEMKGEGDILTWLGPAIGPNAFEVGDEVRHSFLAGDIGADSAFKPSANGRWLADIYALARRRLQQAGVDGIYGGDFCTFTDARRFYSYRRDGRTGRMASLIWLE